MSNTQPNAPEYFDLLCSIENEDQFLLQLAKHQHQLLDEDGTVYRGLFCDLLGHAVQRQWLKAIPVLSELGEQSLSSLYIWTEGVKHIQHESTCDWFISKALHLVISPHLVLERGTQEMAQSADGALFSYWLDRAFEAHPYHFNLKMPCGAAAMSGRMDNVTSMLQHMNVMQIANVMVTAAKNNKQDVVDFLYTTERGMMVEHILGAEPKHDGVMDGLIYLQHKIKSDADRFAISSSMDEHLGVAGKGRKI